MNNKGLSTIITTLIIILMVLVAIGIVWYAVLPMIQSGSETVDLSTKCIGIDIKGTVTQCIEGANSTYDCTVNLKRQTSSTTTAIDGIGLTFSSDTETFDEVYVEGDVATTKITTLSDVPFNATIVAVRGYFNNGEEKYFCTATQ